MRRTRKAGFWSAETLIMRLPQLVSPFDEGNVRNSAYELTLGPEAFVTSEANKQLLPPSGEIVIQPGHFAVLISAEQVSIPDDALALISMKSDFKFRGLINVSGFHVDPGFSGCLIFSVFNAGVQEIHISRGSPIFSIWFAALDQPTKKLYKGRAQGQTKIPDSVVTNLAGKQLTAAALYKEVDEAKREVEKAKQIFSQEAADVRKEVAHWKALTMLALGALVSIFLTVQFKPREVPSGSTTPGRTSEDGAQIPQPSTPKQALPNPTPSNPASPSPSEHLR